MHPVLKTSPLISLKSDAIRGELLYLFSAVPPKFLHVYLYVVHFIPSIMAESSLSTFCLLSGIASARYLCNRLCYLPGDKHTITSFILKETQQPSLPPCLVFFHLSSHFSMFLYYKTQEFRVMSAWRNHSTISLPIHLCLTGRDFIALWGLRSVGAGIARGSWLSEQFINKNILFMLFLEAFKYRVFKGNFSQWPDNSHGNFF